MGGICIVSVDFLTMTTANSMLKIGQLPDGMNPIGSAGSDQTGSEGVAYIGPLKFRGDGSLYGQMMVTNSGAITAYVNRVGSYFFGQLVFPVTRS